MQAYLLVGQGITNFQLPISNLATKLKAKVLEFPLKGIDDARALNSFTSLKITAPTAIYIDSIEEATTEAANAFLKNLEEPQDNLYYILTCSSAKKVLPTIVSRCQIIKSAISHQPLAISKEVQKFLRLSVGERLAYVDKIKDREEAKGFVEDLIAVSHDLLHDHDGANYLSISKNLKTETTALSALKANGNVNLQLTNMVINLL